MPLYVIESFLARWIDNDEKTFFEGYLSEWQVFEPILTLVTIPTTFIVQNGLVSCIHLWLGGMSFLCRSLLHPASRIRKPPSSLPLVYFKLVDVGSS